MQLANAKTLPKIYYGLHMEPGLAEYVEPEINNGAPYRIMIDEEVIRNMNPTFAGRPVYVRHVDSVDLDKIQEDADGYVVESFYNACDGKTWVKFIVVSDRGHEAIRNGWQLSNAYIPKEMSGGGLWHGVEYQKKVERGEYEHLAIVPNPRYEDSIILTPEDFKSYNQEKEFELKQIANSKEKGDSSMLSFFKKTKVENSTDMEGTSVVLPKSKKEMTIAQIVNAVDDYELKMKEPQMANGDHGVMVGDKKMTVNELVAKHMALHQEHEEMKKMHDSLGGDEADKDAKALGAEGGEGLLNDEDAEAKKKALELAEHEDKEMKAKKNAADKARKEHFDKLKNAPNAAAAMAMENLRIETSEDKVARGKSRYGSN